MKLAALKNTDPWFGRMQDALGAGKTDAMVLKDVPVDSKVFVEDADVQFDGPERGHRPWMRISGVLHSMVPEVEMPYGIEELTFATSPSTVMDYRYDFTEEQLAQLVLDKGLFREELRPLADVTGIEWELPSTVDMLLVAPESMEDPPLVFVDIHEQNSRSIDEELSGYDLVEYFPQIVPEQGPGHSAQHAGVPTRADEIEDLFAQDSMDDIEVETPDQEPAVQEQSVAAPRSAFQELVDAANLAREERRRQTAAELSELDPERAEAIYEDRMAGIFEQALAEQSGSSPDPAEVGLVEVPDANDPQASSEAADLAASEDEQEGRRRSESARRIQREVEADERAERRGEQDTPDGADQPGDIVFD